MVWGGNVLPGPLRSGTSLGPANLRATRTLGGPSLGEGAGLLHSEGLVLKAPSSLRLQMGGFRTFEPLEGGLFFFCRFQTLESVGKPASGFFALRNIPWLCRVVKARGAVSTR